MCLVAPVGRGVERRVVEIGHRAGPSQVAVDFSAGEDARQRVVILGEDGIELVIVTARASHGQSHERLGRGIDLLVDHVIDSRHAILLRQRLGTQSEESGGHDAPLVHRARLFGGNQIAGDLLHDEPVIRQFVVERLHDVVAIAPGVRVVVILVHASRVGEARHVQPMAAPGLAILRRAEQAIHHFRECVFGLVGQERVDFLGRGRQARQVVGDAPQQGQLRRRWRRLDSLLFQLRQDESINRTLDPLLVLHPGRSVILHGLKGPVLPAFLDAIVFRRRQWRIFGSGRAHLDPRFQIGDLLVGQLARRRHLDFLRVADHLVKSAVLGVARHHHSGESLNRRQVQPGHLRLRAMTGITLRGKNRTDLLLVELQLFGGLS